MKTKNVPKGLKCKINDNFFSNKGGGSTTWEKFPNNTAFFFECLPYAKIHEKRDNKKHEASLIIAMSVKEIVTYDQKKFIQSTSPYLITFNLYLLQNCEEKRQQVHSTYAMLFQQINKHKYNKHTKTENIQTQQKYTSNKQTKITNIQTQQTNIQIQQQQK